MIGSDARRVFGSGRIWVCSFMAVILLAVSKADALMEIAGADEPVAYGSVHKLILEVLEGNLMLFLVPVLCVLPFAAAVMEDVQSGMIKSLLPRTTMKMYIFSKALLNMLGASVVLLVTVLSLTVFLMTVFSGFETPPIDGAAHKVFVQTIFGRCMLFILNGSIWSLLGVALSCALASKYMALIAPFMVQYLLVILHERYFDSLFLFYPKEWLSGASAWPFGIAGLCIWLILLLALVLIFFAHTVRRCLRN